MNLAIHASPASTAGAVHVGRDRARARAFVFFGLCAAILLHNTLLADPDTQWHIAVGNWIWHNGRLPHSDSFSHTFAGAPWVAKEWLAQLVFAGSFAALGWTGPVLVATVALAAALALLFGFLQTRIGSLAALLLVLLVYVLAQSQLLARPHIFVFPLVAIWTIRLAVSARSGRRPPWPLLAVVVLWANLHASFPLAFVIAAPFAAEALASAGPAQRGATFLRWALFGTAAVLGSMLTPYGLEPLMITLNLSNGGEAVPLISEWQPMGWDLKTALAALLLATAVPALGMRPVANVFRILLVALMAALAYRYGRFLGLFGMVAAVTMADALGAVLRQGPSTAAARRSGVHRQIVSAALAASILATGLASVFERWTPDPKVTPESAFAAADRRGLTAMPVYNSYDFGGFLLAKGVKTFIDGRTDQLFLGGFITRLFALALGAADEPFVDFVEAHGARWAIVKTGSGEAGHFRRSARWSRIYEDDVATLFVDTAAAGAGLAEPEGPASAALETGSRTAGTD